MRRPLLIAVFLLVVIAIAVSAHTYLWERLVADTALGQPWRALALGALVLLGASWFAQPVVAELLPPAWARVVAWPASLWMGAAWLLVIGLLMTDALWWLAGATSYASTGTGSVDPTVARTRAGLVLGLACAGSALGLTAAFRQPGLRRVEVTLKRWPRALDEFRIVQISDIHFGPLLGRAFAQALVARCNALAPDLIAITGDLVDGSVRRVGREVQPFAQLSAPHGVFFITGNHDYFSGADSWVDFVRGLGIRVLRNEHVRIDVGEAGFDLAGVDDDNGARVAGTAGSDIPGALAGRDGSRALVLLAHDPVTFPSAARHGVDLQISGHTHGGQIWPFMYFVRLVTPYVAGLHRRSDSQIYVSRGTGFWGPCMRLFAPAEITELVLRSTEG